MLMLGTMVFPRCHCDVVVYKKLLHYKNSHHVIWFKVLRVEMGRSHVYMFLLLININQVTSLMESVKYSSYVQEYMEWSETNNQF